MVAVVMSHGPGGICVGAGGRQGGKREVILLWILTQSGWDARGWGKRRGRGIPMLRDDGGRIRWPQRPRDHGSLPNGNSRLERGICVRKGRPERPISLLANAESQFDWPDRTPSFVQQSPSRPVRPGSKAGRTGRERVERSWAVGNSTTTHCIPRSPRLARFELAIHHHLVAIEIGQRPPHTI